MDNTLWITYSESHIVIHEMTNNNNNINIVITSYNSFTCIAKKLIRVT